MSQKSLGPLAQICQIWPLIFLGSIHYIQYSWPCSNYPKMLGAKFGPGVPNFLGTFSRPICQEWTTWLKICWQFTRPTGYNLNQLHCQTCQLPNGISRLCKADSNWQIGEKAEHLRKTCHIAFLGHFFLEKEDLIPHCFLAFRIYEVVFHTVVTDVRILLVRISHRLRYDLRED